MKYLMVIPLLWLSFCGRSRGPKSFVYDDRYYTIEELDNDSYKLYISTDPDSLMGEDYIVVDYYPTDLPSIMLSYVPGDTLNYYLYARDRHNPNDKVILRESGNRYKFYYFYNLKDTLPGGITHPDKTITLEVDEYLSGMTVFDMSDISTGNAKRFK